MATKRYIPKDVEKRLFERSDGRCAICDAPGKLCSLERAHITAVAERGPRWVTPHAIETGVNSYDNLILLCVGHHKLVDREPFDSFWTVPRLKKLKRFHEAYWGRVNQSCSRPAPSLNRLHENEALHNAVRFAAAGHKEEAIDAYLDALARGMEMRQLLVVVVACVSITELMDLAAGSTGLEFGMTCCRRAEKLCRSLEEGYKNVYKLCVAWNEAHLQLHILCEISRGAPNTEKIFAFLKDNGFYERWMGKKIKLPYPTILSGETARHLVGPDAERITPTEQAYFSPRYLGLYKYFCEGAEDKSSREAAADLWLSNEDEISDVYDGAALLALANLERMQYNETKRCLSQLETQLGSFPRRREEAEANANLVCLVGWLNSHRYDNCPQIWNLDELLHAVRERELEGNKETGLDAESTKIWASPYLQPVRDRFCSLEELRRVLGCH